MNVDASDPLDRMVGKEAGVHRIDADALRNSPIRMPQDKPLKVKSQSTTPNNSIEVYAEKLHRATCMCHHDRGLNSNRRGRFFLNGRSRSC